jgi:hypothetical protein
MPTRMLREGILSSDKVDTLNSDEEVFYRRLMSIVDDFGRSEADPRLLRAACFPLRVERISTESINKWLSACQHAGLVTVYTVSGKTYLQFENLGKPRSEKSKYPGPLNTQMNTSVTPVADVPYTNSNSVSVSVSGSYSSAGSYSGSAAATTRPPLPALTAEEFAGPDVEQIAQQTASTLTKSHWFPSDLNLSRGFLATELATAVNPIALAESIADSHRQWREQVEKARQSGSLPKTVENKALQWWLKDRYFDQKPKFGPISAEPSKPKPKPASSVVVKLPPNGQALTREQVEAIRAGASVE